MNRATSIRVDGGALARDLREEASRRFAALVAERGVEPRFAIVQVGDQPASTMYTRQLQRAFAAAGVATEVHQLPHATPRGEAVALIRSLSATGGPHGIQIQTPLPPQLPLSALLDALNPAKDLDGAHPYNLGRLAQGDPTVCPATPRAGLEILLRHGVSLSGARAVVVGRSTTVGRPMALLLLQRDATVTICHSRTVDLGAAVREADVVAVAAGRPGLVSADMIRPGAAVIDFGTTVVDGKTLGDVDPAAVDRAGLFTPVPGGVGPVTTAMLLHNALALYERSTEAIS